MLNFIFSHSYADETKEAIFAGGCFWSMQADFDKVPGVVKTIVGYSGGTVAKPTYEQVSSGKTGHYEVVQVTYDPAKTSYEKLLDVYWHNIDPTNAKGQFCDIGSEYRPVIFYHDEDQQKLAIKSKQALIQSGRFKQVATQILPEKTFYPAEDYHQKYTVKNPGQYYLYRYSCGQDERLKELWGKSE